MVAHAFHARVRRRARSRGSPLSRPLRRRTARRPAPPPGARRDRRVRGTRLPPHVGRRHRPQRPHESHRVLRVLRQPRRRDVRRAANVAAQPARHVRQARSSSRRPTTNSPRSGSARTSTASSPIPRPRAIILLEGVGTSPEVNALRSRIRREIADLIRDLWAEYDPEAAAGPHARARSRSACSASSSSRWCTSPRRTASTKRRRTFPRSSPRSTACFEPRRSRSALKLGIVTPALTLLPARARAVGGDGDVRRRRRRSCRKPSGSATTTARAANTSACPSTSPRCAAAATTTRSRRSARSARSPTSIRFAAHVLVLGYHHPLAIAKRYGTLDVVTGGRVILGVGVGSLQEEFELLGAPFADRGARADDAMRALRAALSQPRARVSRRVLRLRRLPRRPVRGAGARADVGRRPDVPVAAPRGRARRRLGAVRAAHRRARGDARRRARHRGVADRRPFDVIAAERTPARPARRTRRARRAARHASTAIGATGVNVRFVAPLPRALPRTTRRPRHRSTQRQ